MLSNLQPRELEQSLLDEVFKMLGLPSRSILRPLLKPVFSPAVKRFAKLAVGFDNDVKVCGFDKAARQLLLRFTRDIHVTGTDGIPSEGALLIVSNHPGTYDALTIASSLPRRDLKIIASGVPFIRHLTATANHLIYSSLDTYERMKVIRAVIRHLENDGAVLIFPSGGIDPDPAIMPGSLEELDTWSPSLDVILRRVPSTRILIAAVSGVLHPGWVSSPIVRVRQGRRNQQRVAEFFQVIQQMLFPNSLLVSPVVSYANPLLLPPNSNSSSLSTIIPYAKEHFRQLKG
jgi:hypothetical protein